jgi:WXG100 family type VII secretion target
MSGFAVEPGELASAAASVRDAGEHLQHGLARLTLDVETLLDGWHGGAGSSFAAAWDQWRVGAAEVLAAAGEMAQLLEATGRGYSAAEAANGALL